MLWVDRARNADVIGTAKVQVPQLTECVIHQGLLCDYKFSSRVFCALILNFGRVIGKTCDLESFKGRFVVLGVGAAHTVLV